ncbi:MAG: 50S ribosomal protein L29 [Myxococcales bacterium]|nr:50S ribosomal protein L29 [Myxococcales bacterium]
MKAEELRERTDGELKEMERDLTRDIWKTRFANFTNQLDDTAKIRRLRRELSRVKTIITERAGQEAASSADNA